MKIDRQHTYSVKYDERNEKFGCDDVLPLWVADMDLPTPPFITTALEARASHPIYGYTVFPPRFYDAIISWYDKRHTFYIDAEEIIPTNGVVPSLVFGVEALCKERDGVLIQTPVYPPFLHLAKGKRTLLTNPLALKNGRYEIDFADFEEKLQQASVFVLCSPHNPVGRVWSKEELTRMGELCVTHNVSIISDEIHSDLTYTLFTMIASLSPEIANITITLNAPSKTFNVAGLNTSYAIIKNPSLRRKFHLPFQKYHYTLGNVFGIEALMSAYESDGTWVEESLKTLQEHIAYVDDFLKTHTAKIKAHIPEATFLLWLDCREMGLDDEALKAFFTEDAKLGLNAGVEFGQEGTGFMRLNIATSKSTLIQAMAQLKIAYDLL